MEAEGVASVQSSSRTRSMKRKEVDARGREGEGKLRKRGEMEGSSVNGGRN